jgi:hypothetical protein
MVAALVGTAACSAGNSAQPSPEGGAPAMDGLDGDARDAPDVMQGADAGCGPIPGPNAWPDWVMPNPPRSGLPNPAGYTV